VHELRQSGLTQRFACPACGYPTLDERGGYNICRVCHWEDDGLDYYPTDNRPRGSRGSVFDVPSDPNRGYTLRIAMQNVEQYGIADSKDDPMTPPEYLEPLVCEARSKLSDAYRAHLEHPSGSDILAIEALEQRLYHALYDRYL